MLQAATLELDDRREIWRMLARLDERQRIRFLWWCCRQVNAYVISSTGTVMEVYYDIMDLNIAFKLNLSRVAEQLVQVCKRL
jgi:hypothetical protein